MSAPERKKPKIIISKERGEFAKKPLSSERLIKKLCTIP